MVNSFCIGEISACIGGDYRYGTCLRVLVEPGLIRIMLRSRSPVGGMDGPDATFETDKEVRRFNVSSAERPKAAPILVAELRKLFKKVDGGTIARYGTPTKSFNWFIDGEIKNGLSAALARQALEATPL